MLDHPKWVRAVKAGGSGAVHLWLCMATWSARHLTDGIIPADMMGAVGGPERNTSRALDALVASGLCSVDCQGTVTIHDFNDYNPTREQVMSARERMARNKRNSRLARPVTGARHQGVTEGVIVSQPDPSPAQPSPIPPVAPQGAPKKKRASLWHDVPTDWQPNQKHRERCRNWPSGFFQREVDAFRNHRFAAGKSDPDKTFTNWLISAEKRLRIGPPKNAPKAQGFNW
jgi:hypothetical protein